MSWDAYVTNLQKSGKCTEAALVGLDGSVWATSSNLSVTQIEALAIVAGMNSNEKFQQEGVKVGGQKYMFIKGDTTYVIGKKASLGVVAAHKTKLAVIIGVFESTDNSAGADCNMAVGTLADYLRGQNY